MGSSNITPVETPIVTTIARYASSTLYRRVLGIGYAFLKPKLLSPELYGLWSALNLIPRYSQFADLGCRESLRFALPGHRARGDSHEISLLRGTAYYSSLIPALLICVLLFILAVTLDTSLSLRLGLATMALVVLMQWYAHYQLALLKALEDFAPVSRANFLQATVSVASGILLLPLLGIHGLYLAVLVTHLWLVLYLRSRHPASDSDLFSRERMLSMIGQGLPIVLYNMISLLTRSADRLVVTGLLGLEQMGYYALAVTIFSLLIQIPGASREVLEPVLMRKSAQLSPQDMLRQHFFRPLLYSAFLMPLLIAPVLFLMPSVLPYLLPRYADAVLPAQILALGSYFMALAFAARGFIVARNWQKSSLLILAVALAANIALSYLLVSSGLGLAGAGLASLSAYALMFWGIFLFIRRRTGDELSASEWRRCAYTLWLPLLPGVVIFLVVEALRLEQAADLALWGGSAWLFISLLALALLPWVKRRFPELGLSFSIARSPARPTDT